MFNCRKNFNGFNFVQNHTFLKFFNALLLLFTSLLELIIENLKLHALSIFLQNDLWRPLICEIWLVFHLTYSDSVFDFISKPVIWFAVQIKWLVSIWNLTLVENGLIHSSLDSSEQFLRGKELGPEFFRHFAVAQKIYQAIMHLVLSQNFPKN